MDHDQKEVSLNDLMVFLKDMKADTTALRADNKLMRDDIQRLIRDNQVIRTKMDTMIRGGRSMVL